MMTSASAAVACVDIHTSKESTFKRDSKQFTDCKSQQALRPVRIEPSFPGLLLYSRCFSGLHRPLVVAFLVGTGNHRAGFQRLVDKVLTAAARAFFGDWPIGGGELTFWII